MRILFCFLMALLAMGCTSAPSRPAEQAATKSAPQPAQPEKLEMVPVQMVKGRVAFVNPAARFVVLDFFASPMPQNDQRLSVYRGGQKVGEVKISGPTRDHNTVADVTAGEVRVGDTAQSD